LKKKLIAFESTIPEKEDERKEVEEECYSRVRPLTTTRT
jgi:hypothetical protein